MHSNMNVNFYCVVLLSAACCFAHCSFDNCTKCKLEGQKLRDLVLAESEFIISESRGGNQHLLVVHIICEVQHTGQT